MIMKHTSGTNEGYKFKSIRGPVNGEAVKFTSLASREYGNDITVKAQPRVR